MREEGTVRNGCSKGRGRSLGDARPSNSCNCCCYWQGEKRLSWTIELEMQEGWTELGLYTLQVVIRPSHEKLGPAANSKLFIGRGSTCLFDTPSLS